MELIVSICRYLLPALALVIFVKCFMTLFLGHPVNSEYAYLENTNTGERITLNMWETSIGKSKTCDIMLNSGVVSRFHAVICRRVDGWYVFDTLSKNGTYVKKTGVSSSDGADSESAETSGLITVEKDGVRIENGDTIFFSKEKYRFTVLNDPVIRVGKRKNRSKKVSSAAYREKTGKPITDLKSVTDIASGNKLAAMTNKKRNVTYLLIEHVVKIGRSQNNDIVISDPSVSRIHAVMTYRDGVWSITDKNSANGTKVNGKVITSAVELCNYDTVTIGEETFLFTREYE